MYRGGCRLALRSHFRAPNRTRNWREIELFAAGTNPSSPACESTEQTEKRNREPAHEPPQDEARKIVEEYADSLRESIRKLRRHFN